MDSKNTAQNIPPKMMEWDFPDFTERDNLIYKLVYEKIGMEAWKSLLCAIEYHNKFYSHVDHFYEALRNFLSTYGYRSADFEENGGKEDLPFPLFLEEGILDTVRNNDLYKPLFCSYEDLGLFVREKENRIAIWRLDCPLQNDETWNILFGI